VTGVDFAGPLYYKPVASKKARRQTASSERSTEEEAPTEEDEDTRITVYHLKCYVCLFTWAVTRTVHLELVPDLSARSFLLAFRRFPARRGNMVADHSSNRTCTFSTGESRFLSTSQVILSIGAVPYPMELPPYPIDSYRLVDAYELVDAYGLVFIA
jgi:hypothetical protein